MANAAARVINNAQQKSEEACARVEAADPSADCKTAIEKMHEDSPWLGYLIAFAILALLVGPTLWKLFRRKD